jgi:DNA-binding winged helix-turn-helix (wHTH) protein
MRIRFGDSVLDAETRELSRGGEVVHISPKAFQFLELLVRERPRALSKEEILERLWGGTTVTDGTLTTTMAEARAAIGDDAQKPRFIRTVHRFGYAFSGDAQEEQRTARGKAVPPFAWRLHWETRDIALPEGDNIVGRDPEAAVLVDHASVSRHHARISVAGENATLEDLDSKNGTFLRGERIRKAVRLTDRDEVRFGSVGMTFRLFSLPATTETTPEK